MSLSRCWRAVSVELLELAVREDEHRRRGSLEGDAALEAEDRVAEVDAAADAEGRRERVEALDERDRREPLAVDRNGHASIEADAMDFRRARPVERAAREHPGVLRQRIDGVVRLLTADGDSPRARGSPNTRRARSGPRSPSAASAFTSCSREKPSSRIGAMTSRSGASVRRATSKRT